MRRIVFISIIPLIFLCCSKEKATTDLSNIILVMADDLGYGDAGCYRNTIVKTSNLDAMENAGIRFERFYAATPVCSPTRGSCLTGRHPYRSNIPWVERHALPKEEITIAEALKTIGYATGYFGRWHVGGLSGTVILYEGGVHVLAIFEWPKKIQNPFISQLPVFTSDFYPTILSIFGVEMNNQPQLGGMDMIDLIVSGSSERPEPLFFQSPVPNRFKKTETNNIEQFAVLDNQFKLNSIDNGKTFQLYNLIKDSSGSIGISAENYLVFNEMKLQLKGLEGFM